jgi:hypothetical protein
LESLLPQDDRLPGSDFDGRRRIVDTDDDNIPKENWAFPPDEGEFSLQQKTPAL